MATTPEPSPDETLDHLIAAGDLRGAPHRAAHDRRPRQPGRHGPERQQKPAKLEVPGPAVESPLLRAHGIPHGFSVRTGGVSTAYGAEGLNLGFTASDARENVLQNRARLLRHVFGAAQPLATLRQRHTSMLREVHAGDSAEEASLVGDALFTVDRGLVLGVQTADCVPVLVASKDGHVVAAFHAGWRGTLSRIVECGIGRLRAELGIAPDELVAAIGPSIRACCYATGEEVEAEFRSQFSYAEELFCDVYDTEPVRRKYPMLFLTQRAPGHSDLGPNRHLDLAEANRRQLLDAGLPESSVDVLPHCTACRTDLFFSHRAEAGYTGRMLNVIGLSGEAP